MLRDPKPVGRLLGDRPDPARVGGRFALLRVHDVQGENLVTSRVEHARRSGCDLVSGEGDLCAYRVLFEVARDSAVRLLSQTRARLFVCRW